MPVQNPKTVLIVDDDPETAEMLAEMLRVSGYRAIKSFGGAVSINLFSSDQPDVVLLDIMMTEINGIDVLRHVRQDPQLTHIPVVIISARNMPSDIQSGLEAGAYAYLTKPVSFSDLTFTIKQALVNTNSFQ